MLKLVKEYCNDYAVAQKSCDDFYRKHWKGNIIVVGLAWLLIFGWFYVIVLIKQKKQEKQEKQEKEHQYTNEENK